MLYWVALNAETELKMIMANDSNERQTSVDINMILFFIIVQSIFSYFYG